MQRCPQCGGRGKHRDSCDRGFSAMARTSGITPTDPRRQEALEAARQFFFSEARFIGDGVERLAELLIVWGHKERADELRDLCGLEEVQAPFGDISEGFLRDRIDAIEAEGRK